MPERSSPVIAMVVLRVFWKYGVFSNLLSKIAVALLLCGIFGNLTDRVFRAPGSFQGRVVDFIEPVHFAVFNLADSAICWSPARSSTKGASNRRSRSGAASRWGARWWTAASSATPS